jgi:flagellin-like hook-associated protein FlgL
MRITNRMMVDNAIQNIADSREKSAKLTNQISTGKQFQTASEDPVRASLSLSLRSNLRTIDSFVDTTDSTKDWMNTTDYAFNQLETLANRASTLVLKGLNDTLSSTIDASVSLTPTLAGTVTEPVAVVSVGTNQVELNTGTYTLATRDLIGPPLQHQFRLVDAAGVAQSILTQGGDKNDPSAYTSDWQPMTSGSYDTGRGLNLTLDSAGTTPSTLTYIPAGKERASSLGVEMQALVQQAIDIGNTSNNGLFIFAGYQVDKKPFDLANAGTTFTDVYGKTQPNRIVTYAGDSGTMERSLGPEQKVTLNVPGDPAIKRFIQTLVQASEALVKRPYDSASLQKSLTDLQSSLGVLDQNRTSFGARFRQVESAADYLDQIKLETQNLLSKKEDANVAEAIVSLANEKTTFQAVLEVSQRAISSLSLFDYIQ